LEAASEIDPNEDIYGFFDESSFQNQPNISRVLRKKGEKAKAITNGKKIKISVAGFQSPNGNSILYTDKTINTFHFTKALLQLRMSNMNNEEISEGLQEILTSKSFDDECIKNSIPTKKIGELRTIIHENISDLSADKDLTIKRIQKIINEENTEDKRKISKIKAENFILDILDFFNIEVSEDLIRKPLKLKELFENEEEVEKLFPNSLKYERRIVILIDNYSVHRTYISKILCKILNIKLIYLPKYSPFLNPIEQLWRTMKNILHRNPIKDLTYLKSEVIKLFDEFVNSETFYKKWIDDYITIN
jgi:transposase